MADLGEFGTAREAYTATFGYFGRDVRVHPDLSDLALIEFAQMGAALGEDTSGAQAIGMVMEMLRSLVHPDDFDMFWKAARSNRQTLEDLTSLAEKLVVAVTERPTEQPSSSSAGRHSTVVKSEEGSSSRVADRLEGKGRPDLALMVNRAEEFLASA